MYSCLALLVSAFPVHPPPDPDYYPSQRIRDHDEDSLDTLNGSPKKTHVSPYDHLIGRSYLDDSEFMLFAQRVYSALEQLDSAGVKWSTIFFGDISPQQQMYMTRSFIMNIHIWGSYHPLKKALSQEMSQRDHLSESVFQMKAVEESLDKLIQQHRVSRDKLDEVANSLIADLETISWEVRLLRERQDDRLEKQSSTPHFDISKSTLFSLDTEHMHMQNTDLEMGSKPEKQQKHGHLIPLSCGHNGNLSQTQYQLLLMHLRKANFIE